MNPKKLKDVVLPPNVYIGKEQSNGIMVGGKPAFVGVAQLFLQCVGKEKKCHDTIAILPKKNANRSGNDIVDSISDKVAGKIFEQYGWLVKGYNNPKYTRCPICAKKVRVKKTTPKV